MSGREWLVYTDGSCKAAPGAPGGWGFHVRSPKGEVREGSGKAVNTQAKTMEYRAVAEALAALPDAVSVVVWSDNQPLIANLSKQLGNWRATGFAKVDPEIVECVRRIDATIVEKRLAVSWQWLRGHNGNVGNERADALAAEAAREAKRDLEEARRRR